MVFQLEVELISEVDWKRMGRDQLFSSFGSCEHIMDQGSKAAVSLQHMRDWPHQVVSSQHDVLNEAQGDYNNYVFSFLFNTCLIKSVMIPLVDNKSIYSLYGSA